MGLPFNRFVTINWERAGIDHVQRAQGAFLKRARDWLRTVGANSAHVWIVEQGGRVGLHIHALLHVDPTLTRRFSDRQIGWLRRSGAKVHRGLIKSKPIGRSYWLAVTGQHELYAHHLAALIDYMTKDRCRDAQQRSRHSPSAGKRCATSQNVGRTSRKRERRSAALIAETCVDHFDKRALERAIWEALEVAAVQEEPLARSLDATL